jgi:hypothetical protein
VPSFEVKTTRGGDDRTVVKVITRVRVRTMLFHASGEWLINWLDTLLPTADPQSIGSAVTYLRRYALAALVGVAPDDVDDDGEAALQRSASRSVVGPASPALPTQPASPAPEVETHAERIARVKREQQGKAASAPAPAPAPSNSHPVPTGSEPKAVTPAQITGINVRNGPLVVKEGKTVPSWGPLYVVTFSAKVRATDGTLVADAATFDEELAQTASAARDSQQVLTPRVEPGAKRGSYKLIAFV